MIRSLEQVLDVMTTWFQQNCMKINAGKTEVLLCGDRRQLRNIPQPIRIKFMGEEICSKNVVRNLGVYMDCNLSWSHHVKCVSDRCFGILVALYHARHILPVKVLPRIIDSMVFSHIRYCIQVYGSTNQESKDKIQKVFNFGARVISGRKKFDHISDVLKDLRWLNAREYFDYHDLCLMHRLIETGEPKSLAACFHFNRDRVDRETRQSSHLSLPRPRTSHVKRSFVYRGSQLFNNVCMTLGPPQEMSYGNFKKAIREMFFSE